MDTLDEITNTIFEEAEIAPDLRAATKKIDEKVSFLTHSGITEIPYFMIHRHYLTCAQEINEKYENCHRLSVKTEAQKGTLKFIFALADYLGIAEDVTEVSLLYSALEKAGTIAYASKKRIDNTELIECPTNAILKFMHIIGKSASGIETNFSTDQEKYTSNERSEERVKYLKFINYILEGKDDEKNLRWNHIEQNYPLSLANYAALRLSKAQYNLNHLKEIVMGSISSETHLSSVASEQSD